MSHTMHEIVEAFKAAIPKKTVFGQYRIEGDRLIYRAQSSEEVRGKSHDEVRARLKELDGKLVDSDNKTVTRISDLPESLYGYRIQYFETNTVAQKINRETIVNNQTDKSETFYLGNGSILDLIGRTVAYGNESRNTREVEIQQTMRNNGFIMVPFSVFEQAGLDISTFERIEQGPEETFKVKEKNPRHNNYGYKGPEFLKVNRHFVGASLFKVGTEYFLFDVDRRELRHRIFNPFLVKLSRKVATIKEAYQALKPKAVRDAESKGLKVQRQGEWFFIPVPAPKVPELTLEEKLQVLVDNTWSSDRALMKRIAGIDAQDRRSARSRRIIEKVPRQLNLQVGNNRPNTVQLGLTLEKITYCTGVVKHTGREHANLVLKGWYRAIPNTSYASFTITGDID